MSVWKQITQSAVVNTVMESIEMASFQNGIQIKKSANCVLVKLSE